MDGELMSDNSFFKPTLLYKEFMILDLIEKDANITQREISRIIGVAVSMTNAYIENFVEKGLIKKKKHSTKTVEYFITKKGMERRKLLNIGYLNSTQQLYNSAKENIDRFILQIKQSGIRKIILYGAGGVSEILLNCVSISNLQIIALIDDDYSKHGKYFNGFLIQESNIISDLIYDGILVATYNHKDAIIKKLKQMNIDQKKIIDFFN